MANSYHHSLYFRAKLALDVQRSLDDSVKLFMLLLDCEEERLTSDSSLLELAGEINQHLGSAYELLDELGPKLARASD